MVQMKEKNKKSIESIEKILYIPHGSDERSVIIIVCVEASIFISHMVQMKVHYPSLKVTLYHTLYPTWFR